MGGKHALVAGLVLAVIAAGGPSAEAQSLSGQPLSGQSLSGQSLSGQPWPAKPIRWLVPVAAGGATDVVARLLQEPVAKRLGTSIIVENRPGGAGIIATQAAVTAPPDGTTMALVFTSHAVNPAMQAKLPYDSSKDITPIAFFWRAQLAFSVLTESPLKSLADLIDAARKEPGRLAYGTGGVGTGAHLAAALLTDVANIKLTHAPYRGAAPALNDLLGGQVPILVSNVSALPMHIEAGRVRPLAVTGAQRSAVLPNVPTVAESGFPGYEATEWSGLIGAAHLPPDVAPTMNAAVNDAIREPAVAEQYRKMGLETIIMSPGEFRAFLDRETAKFSELIRKSGIRAE
jgi:tripartite-type tricarboxylate transporter receptor subunit TctC